MELLVGAAQEAGLLQDGGIGLGGEGDVRRGNAEPLGHGLQPGGKRRLGHRLSAPFATSRRGPVTGVNGMEACSFG